MHREIAARTIDGVRVRAGGLGLMTLRGQEVFLDPEMQRISVPRYLYRFITYRVNEANQVQLKKEVYLTFNNPHVAIQDIQREVERIFGNVNYELGLHVTNVPEITTQFVPKGLTFSVTIDTFMEGLNHYHDL